MGRWNQKEEGNTSNYREVWGDRTKTLNKLLEWTEGVGKKGGGGHLNLENSMLLPLGWRLPMWNIRCRFSNLCLASLGPRGDNR